MSALKKFLGFNGDSGARDVLKFLLLNVGGRFSAVCTVILGLLYLIAPELNEHWAAFFERAQVTVVLWMLASMFWRGIKNSELLVRALAQKQIADPNMPDKSPDPVIQREVTRQLNGGAQ